jgi:hypothetical protein
MRFLVAVILLLMASVSAEAFTIFTTDFESGIPSAFSGAGTVTATQGYSALGFGSRFLRNDTIANTKTTLTLVGLPTHSTVSLQFLFAAIDSWDGLAQGHNCCAPDEFNVSIGDGATQTPIFHDSFNNMWGFAGGVHVGPDTQGYPRNLGNELRNPSAGSLGFVNWPDSAYDLGADPSFTAIPHTSSVLVVEFFTSGAGWQGGDFPAFPNDESWAIDNISISIDSTPVPEASTLGLLGLGLGCLGVATLRRRPRVFRFFHSKSE